ncbi:MAG: enoyl-CoA hydratase/isomerase family protein [Rhodocyclaceae bacterium]|jgi:enoyl-CoA hydratase/carnithine racemase|nr:enoyl-CoA hydratase/isomerase family protein [Rhodocyclaceae bacterium]
MSTPHLLCNERDGIIEVIFNRPEKFNALTREMYDGLARAVEALTLREDLRVMLIRSTGKYFSAGMDLSAMEAVKVDEAAGSTSEFRRNYRDNAYHWLFDAMEAVEKPIVVAHHAPCLGGALEMSLSCDFRLAGQSAQYGLPEMNIAMIPGSGGTSRLVRTVGTHWARWLIMASEQIDAERALAAGLVHRVIPDAELEQAAWDFCVKLCKQPQEAMRMAKLAIELAGDLGRAQGRNVERLANSALFFGNERAATMEILKQRLSGGKGGR